MSRSDDVGEVSVEGGTSIRWTIPRYLRMPQVVGTALCSPQFTFLGEEECRLSAFPNGLKWDNSEGWLTISCKIPSLPPGYTVNCSIVGREGNEILSTKMAEKYGSCYIRDKWIRQTELEARKKKILPGGQLRVVCSIVLPSGRGHAEEESESGVHNLIQNLKDLYVQGEDCNFTIRVKDREFRVHRCILKARVPAFSAMLTHDMAENRDGVVDIQDCDPDVFNQFLLFVYSGRVENLSPDNMCGLYVLGDKYGLPDLKKICLDFMETSLAVETICDVISLASRHDEVGLMNSAIEYFANHSEEILVTARWKEFMEESPAQGNELFLKAVKKLKTNLQINCHRTFLNM